MMLCIIREGSFPFRDSPMVMPTVVDGSVSKLDANSKKSLMSSVDEILMGVAKVGIIIVIGLSQIIGFHALFGIFLDISMTNILPLLLEFNVKNYE